VHHRRLDRGLDIENPLDGSFAWFSAGLGSFLYWTAAKLLIWIAPALWLLERAGLSAREVLGLRNWRAGLAWGGGVGLLIALTGMAHCRMKCNTKK
jgi:hypothetical protein